MPELQVGRYRNLANEVTTVVGTAIHSQSNELLVLHHMGDGAMIATPYSFFFEIFTNPKGRTSQRFTLVSESASVATKVKA